MKTRSISYSQSKENITCKLVVYVYTSIKYIIYTTFILVIINKVRYYKQNLSRKKID